MEVGRYFRKFLYREKKKRKTKPPSAVWIHGCSTVRGDYTFARPTDRFDENGLLFSRNLSRPGAKRKRTIWFLLKNYRTNSISRQ